MDNEISIDSGFGWHRSQNSGVVNHAFCGSYATAQIGLVSALNLRLNGLL